MIFIVLFASIAYGQVGINTDKPNASAGLHVSERMDPASANPDKYNGTIIQRYTTTERDSKLSSLASAENGLTIYNKTTNCYNIWNWNTGTGTGNWASLCGEKQSMVEFSDCNSIKVIGKYITDKPLSAQTVHIEIPVRVTALGSYSYSSTTVNGVTFSAQGTFLNLGPQVVSLHPTSVTGTPASGTYNCSVTIAPTTAGASGVTCNNIAVSFISRTTSTMKIVNVAGNFNEDLSNTNYAAGLVYKWLTGNNAIGAGNSALSYSGTANIQIVNVDVNKIVDLQEALKDASGIYIGSGTSFSTGFINVIQEWNNETGGFVINYADKTAQSDLANALKFYVENGSANNGILNTNIADLPQIFGAGQPFVLSSGMNVGYEGSASGQIATNKGTNFINVGSSSRTAGVIDLTRNIVIFGDNFGYQTATTVGNVNNNFARVLCDIFAYFIKTAPVN